MYLRVRLVFLFLVLRLVYGKVRPITVKIDPNQVVDVLRSVFTTEYLQNIADKISEKAAKRLVEEINKNLGQTQDISSERPELEEDLEERMEEIEEEKSRHRKEMQLMDSQEAMRLLRNPSPDGDNLEDPSPHGDNRYENVEDSLQLSREQTEGTQKKIPVIGVMKINGVYYRRFLGLF